MDRENSNISQIVVIVVGSISILVGLIYLFLTRRLLRLVTTITGFQAVAGAVFTIMEVMPPADPKILTLNSLIFVPLGAGVIGAMAFGYWVELGVVLIGFCLGAEIWSIIFCFIKYYNKHLFVWPAIFFGIATAYITYRYKNKMAIYSSAFLGSQLVMQGIAFVAQVDYFIKSTNNDIYHFTKRIFWSMFVSSIILTAIGSIFQLNQFSRLDCPRRDEKTPEDYLNL